MDDVGGDFEANPAARPAILVVDDQEDHLSLVCQVLEEERYELMPAGDAESAIAVFEQRRPDLAILDVHMPGLNGFEVCRRLRAHYAHDPVPIIFLTAVCKSTEETIHGLDLGACEYLVKPVGAAELRARVRAVLRTEADHRQRRDDAKRVVRRLMKS